MKTYLSAEEHDYYLKTVQNEIFSESNIKEYTNIRSKRYNGEDEDILVSELLYWETHKEHSDCFVSYISKSYKKIFPPVKTKKRGIKNKKLHTKKVKQKVMKK